MALEDCIIIVRSVPTKMNIRIDKNIVRFNVNARGWHYQLTGFPEDYQLILDVTRS